MKSNWYAMSIRQAASVAVVGTDLNWSLSETFAATLSSSTSYTFSNTSNGRLVTFAVSNTSGSNITLTFPPVIKEPGFTTVVAPSTSSVFTFIQIEGSIYAASIVGMT